jgi:hypothetical protein
MVSEGMKLEGDNWRKERYGLDRERKDRGIESSFSAISMQKPVSQCMH